MIVERDDGALRVLERAAPMGNAEFREGDSGWRIKDGRKTLALVAFSDWKPRFSSVQFSGLWVESFPLSPHIVALLGQYAYGQLASWRVWALTSVKNDRARGLLRQIGFTPEAIHHSYYGPGSHAETFRMLKPEWERRYGTLKEAA